MFIAKENGYLEIIIYFVALVIGLAANAYRAYSKRKARNAQPQQGSETGLPEILFEPVIFETPEPEYTEPEEIAEYPTVEDGGELVEVLPPPAEAEVIDKPDTKEGVPAFAETARVIASYDDMDKEMKESLEEGSNAIYDFRFSDALEE